MTIKEKLLILWVFMVVLAGFAVNHFSTHLTGVLEHLLAVGLPLLCGWD